MDLSRQQRDRSHFACVLLAFVLRYLKLSQARIVGFGNLLRDCIGLSQLADHDYGQQHQLQERLSDPRNNDNRVTGADSGRKADKRDGRE